MVDIPYEMSIYRQILTFTRNEWSALKDMTMDEAKGNFVKMWFSKYRKFVDRELFQSSFSENLPSSLHIKT